MVRPKSRVEGVDKLVVELREQFYRRGEGAIFTFGRLLRQHDRESNGYLDREQIKRVLKEFRVDLKEGEIERVLEKVDQTSQGTIEVVEMERVVVGNMNQFRREQVDKAYQWIHQQAFEAKQSLTLSYLNTFYDPTSHPAVIAQKYTPEALI